MALIYKIMDVCIEAKLYEFCFWVCIGIRCLCDIAPDNTAEKYYTENLSLAGDGFDTVIKAKQAVENVCPKSNTMSCAGITFNNSRVWYNAGSLTRGRNMQFLKLKILMQASPD